MLIAWANKPRALILAFLEVPCRNMREAYIKSGGKGFIDTKQNCAINTDGFRYKHLIQ
jgi:hypothetical protein